MKEREAPGESYQIPEFSSWDGIRGLGHLVNSVPHWVTTLAPFSVIILNE